MKTVLKGVEIKQVVRLHKKVLNSTKLYKPKNVLTFLIHGDPALFLVKHFMARGK